MKIGDLVKYGSHIGIITYIDPEEIGDNEEVEVMWVKGWTDRSNHSTENLRVVSE